MELDVVVTRGEGQLLLDLVEGGVHHRCTVELTTGRATLEIDSGRQPFADEQGRQQTQAVALTPLRGTGRFQIRFANVDDRLFLWIDGRLVEFDVATTFERIRDAVPSWTVADPGDLMPLGVGACNTEFHVARLRVLRDVYYRAVGYQDPYRESEYDRSRIGYDFDVAAMMASPESWPSTPLFAARRSVVFKLGAGQFFPIGDNSPESRDARLWSEPADEDGELYPPPYVTRNLLIGKAVLIYWPHAWRIGSNWLPLIPNFQRMGRIH
jgi:signal peptidase I